MFSISFDFDELTGKVSNIQVDGNAKPKTKAKRKKSADSRPLLEVDENKLILSDALVEALQIEAGERLNINYWTVDASTTFPLIGKSEMFSDKAAGNKLNSANTVSFRGVQRNVLLEYGTLFTIEPWQEGIFKLIPLEDLLSADDSINEELKEDQDDLLGLSDLDQEIAEIMEDLPF